MRRARGTTLLVVPPRGAGGARRAGGAVSAVPAGADVGDVYDFFGGAAVRNLLAGAGIVAEAGSGADLSTAVTSSRWQRIAGCPAATLVWSGDRESGYVYLRVTGPAELVARASAAFDEVEALLLHRHPGLRIRRKN